MAGWELQVGEHTTTLTDTHGRLTPVGKDYRVAANNARKPPIILLPWQLGRHIRKRSDVVYALGGTERTARRYQGRAH